MKRIGIRGAGLGGLSVAQELLRLEPTLHVEIFDRRPRLPHPQRTFCFFQRSDVHLPVAPAFQWDSVCFRGATFERRITVGASPYTMIRGDDFFHDALKDLESRGASFHWSRETVETEGNAIIADGERHAFDCIVDAAFDPRLSRATMWQSFAGVWVTTEAPLFDSSTALLMDLQDSCSETPVSFLYVLPTSRHTALLEHTTFGLTQMPKAYHLERCFAWLEEHGATSYQRGECEQGAIPMGLHCTGGAFSAGSNAGIVRPATGYAFLSALSHARHMSHQLVFGSQVSKPSHPWWLTLGDKVFLRALVKAPERGRMLLEGMLQRANAESLISFLSGSVTPTQALSVWLSVPKIEMIRTLVRI